MRDDSERVRAASIALRVDVRRRAREVAQRRSDCLQTLALAEMRRSRPFRTAWSTLPWRRLARVDDVLEVVDR